MRADKVGDRSERAPNLQDEEANQGRYEGSSRLPFSAAMDGDGFTGDMRQRATLPGRNLLFLLVMR
ncbi:hypothetical protein EOC93_02895 [Mesorhizobium sp. M6A.T.Ce.TU.002.03.1.1]|nr:hypothetical protein EOC93_02895 [Mesorhizobium sp. M6A.T.Ce.TU.002.03.1.1]RVB78295.1 hypothetical protein EN885_10185 [Mesorhizobium sp. M6A.T.Cr.TU.014.01.1.1]RWO98905.1 MAG: hypothetical protein EOQ98_14670 [Mesorhizobium sp.]RWP78887.1 MAG: hypothetical protein EOR10_12380 [Mesorhizobium sp.]RWP79218.1 MAG: hypothetical protein EOR09_03565 [Mesorhizobium sp.]